MKTIIMCLNHSTVKNDRVLVNIHVWNSKISISTKYCTLNRWSMVLWNDVHWIYMWWIVIQICEWWYSLHSEPFGTLTVNHLEFQIFTGCDYYVIKITFINPSAFVGPFKKIIQRKSILMYSFFIIHGPCLSCLLKCKFQSSSSWPPLF